MELFAVVRKSDNYIWNGKIHTEEKNAKLSLKNSVGKRSRKDYHVVKLDANFVASKECDASGVWELNWKKI